ncbi:hypothetical protein GCM10010273_30400 [Streptomyces lavendulocolor]
MDVGQEVVRGLLVAIHRTVYECTDGPVGMGRLVVAHRSMVPWRSLVRGTASTVVHRSVMSRCAGRHLLRPPLPLDRLVPEELHAFKDAASDRKRISGLRRPVRRGADGDRYVTR